MLWIFFLFCIHIPLTSITIKYKDKKKVCTIQLLSNAKSERGEKNNDTI